MENQPLVSIITPVYNQELFLPETVQSVLAVRYPNLEWIMVDDGSVDQSPQIAQQLAESYPWVRFFRQPNAGPAAARNMAIRQASGTYILPLDADDLISPDYISKAVGILEQRSDVKVVYCEAEKFGAKSGLWKLKPFSRKELAKGNMIFVSAMYRRKDWELTGGYAEEMTWGFEDWEFWISMLKNEGEVVKLPIKGFFYRIRPGSRRKSVDQGGRQLTYQFINRKHADFIYKYLNGPIRKSKTWSKLINTFYKWMGIKL
ncbi:glycosyltransferase [Lunatimonas lonarensis]|uniref:Glycosyltransferase n=1 Tax=Lunatimonas lonarensis TaxID=1232681 RepID=R7ZSG6_9BACT|nr:glycosyltransferase family A protein [Lunatimonas lonarensis]EON77050.1 glycosyltransferase [Lunatimonas lonarensis]